MKPKSRNRGFRTTGRAFVPGRRNGLAQIEGPPSSSTDTARGPLPTLSLRASPPIGGSRALAIRWEAGYIRLRSVNFLGKGKGGREFNGWVTWRRVVIVCRSRFAFNGKSGASDRERACRTRRGVSAAIRRLPQNRILGLRRRRQAS